MLCMQCRGIGPHLPLGEKSHVFSRVAAGTWSIFSSYCGDGPSTLVFVQRSQDSCRVMRDTSAISSRIVRAKGTLLGVRQETQDPFAVATGILGFLSMFKRSQAPSNFEAVWSECLSGFQRHVRHSVERSRGPRAFSRDSTGGADIPSPCEMKD